MGLGDYKEMYMGFKKDAYLYTKPLNNLEDDKEQEVPNSLRELIGDINCGQNNSDFLQHNPDSLQHIPDSLQQPSQTEGENNAIKAVSVYACPIDGCTSEMDTKGLQDGSAANHMRVLHKMRPFRMKKLNLMWKKI